MEFLLGKIASYLEISLKRIPHHVFPCEILINFQNNFFVENLWLAASDHLHEALTLNKADLCRLRNSNVSHSIRNSITKLKQSSKKIFECQVLLFGKNKGRKLILLQDCNQFTILICNLQCKISKIFSKCEN